MEELYQNTVANGRRFFHQEYCLYINGKDMVYDRGPIRCICLYFPLGDRRETEVQVVYRNGEVFSWTTKWISSYILQFGVAVSVDGNCVFAQTWENGLFCLNARTGEIIWRTKSKRGITNIFVNEDTVLCHQRERALQLIDIHTGQVLSEKRPATAWGFKTLDHGCIICQVTAKRWEVIDAQTMETKEAFSHKDFTGGYVNYCINRIERTEDGKIKVCGFKNVWDDSVKLPVMLPNLEFEHLVESEFLKQHS